VTNQSFVTTYSQTTRRHFCTNSCYCKPFLQSGLHLVFISMAVAKTSAMMHQHQTRTWGGPGNTKKSLSVDDVMSGMSFPMKPQRVPAQCACAARSSGHGCNDTGDVPSQPLYVVSLYNQFNVTIGVCRVSLLLLGWRTAVPVKQIDHCSKIIPWARPVC